MAVLWIRTTHFVGRVELAAAPECNHAPPPTGHGSSTNSCRLQSESPSRFRAQTIDGVTSGKVVPGKVDRAELWSIPEGGSLTFETALRPGFQGHFEIWNPGLYAFSRHSTMRQGTEVWFLSAIFRAPPPEPGGRRQSCSAYGTDLWKQADLPFNGDPDSANLRPQRAIAC